MDGVDEKKRMIAGVKVIKWMDKVIKDRWVQWCRRVDGCSGEGEWTDTVVKKTGRIQW